MKVIIPAAGEGRRLKPHTATTPKVMIPVAGKPIIGHLFDRVSRLRPELVVVVVSKDGGPIRRYLTSHYQLPLEFVEQEAPRGLGHAVSIGAARTGDAPLLILLGDTIVDFDVRALARRPSAIGVQPVSDPRRFGVVELHRGMVARLVEKPEHPKSDLAIVGIYYFARPRPIIEALQRLMARGQRTRGEYQLTDAIQLAVDQGMRIRPWRIERWLDCGTARSLIETNRALLEKNCSYRERAGVVIIPPVAIHDRARIEHSVIGPYVSVDEDAVIRGSVVRDSIVNARATIEHAVLEGSLVGADAVIRERPRSLNLGASSEIESL